MVAVKLLALAERLRLIGAMIGRSRRALASSALLVGCLVTRASSAIEPAPQPRTVAGPEPVTVEINTRAGFGHRVGSSPSFPIVGRLGGVFGLGIALAPIRRVSIGLGWERSGLGSEHGSGELADIAVSRSMDAFWATLRVGVLRSDDAALILQIAPGLAIQRAQADVLIYPGSAMQATVYRCSGSAGPSFAVRAGIGGEVRLAGPLWVTADALFDHANLSTNALGECAPGAGSLGVFGLRAGLAFRFDVTRWAR